jgi:hypothetical protein
MAKKINKTTIQYGGMTLDLTKSTTHAAVKYNDSRKPAARGATVPPSVGGFEMVSAKRGIETKLEKMRAMPEVAAGSHVWQVGAHDAPPLIPSGNLYIEFTEKCDEDDRNELLVGLGLSVKEVVSERAFRVAITPQSPNPVKCAVMLQKNKKLVRVAEPEFITIPAERFSPPGGTFINTQWHLDNTGNSIPIIDIPNAIFSERHFKRGADAKVKQAWAAMNSLGSSNIKIAVIDTGFSIDHPQLRGDGTKVRSPFNAAARTSDVSPVVRYSDGSVGVASHGTSCAAVAAGYIDSRGVIGAAPTARIIPIKLDILSDEAIKNALEHAFLNGADIISCSLGFPQPIGLSTYVSNYIKKLATEGRGGKGIPMFFAAGNANPSSNNEPRQVSDFAADPNIICVTASNSLDVRSSYSFYGPNAFLCAPTDGDDGVAITTATCEIDGANRVVNGYKSSFGGTSSAAPLVAGVCALILSANPNLNLGQVRGILAQSCDKIGPAGTYNASSHSIYYGYGRVNALRAVQLALGQSGSSTGSTNPPPASPSGALKGRVTSAKLNMRSQPAVSGRLIGTFKRGDVLTLVENVNGWWRLSNGNFVIDDYVQVV